VLRVVLRIAFRVVHGVAVVGLAHAARVAGEGVAFDALVFKEVFDFGLARLLLHAVEVGQFVARDVVLGVGQDLHIHGQNFVALLLDQVHEFFPAFGLAAPEVSLQKVDEVRGGQHAQEFGGFVFVLDQKDVQVVVLNHVHHFLHAQIFVQHHIRAGTVHDVLYTAFLQK